MKKFLLCLFSLSAIAVSAQTEIEPFAPSVSGTYVGDFSTFTPGNNLPAVSAYTEEGDIGTANNDFTVDDGSIIADYSPGAVGNYITGAVAVGTEQTLITPEIDFGTNTTNPTLNFRYLIDNGVHVGLAGALATPNMEIMYKESAGGAWNSLGTYTLVDNAWHNEVLDLSGASSYSTYYLGFRIYTVAAGSILSFGAMGLDEFVLTGESGCTPTASSFPATMCDTYTVPSGDETYTTSGIVNDTIANMAGCDSVMTIDVTIETLDLAVTETGGTITSATAGATYQWIDCSDLSDVAGATSQAFTPTQNGDYAVIVTNGTCGSDTSVCTTIAGIGFDENSLEAFRLFPNPTEGNVTIQFIDFKDVVGVEIYSADGKLVTIVTQFSSQNILLDLSNIKTGLYIVKIIDVELGSRTERLIIR